MQSSLAFISPPSSNFFFSSHFNSRSLTRTRHLALQHHRACPHVFATAADTQQSSTPPLLLYNSLTKRNQLFQTLQPGLVKFYSCGPTVYDYAHIGNFRAFLTYDVIKRWLIYTGYRVRHVMNLTDIDDKIIARAQRDNCSPTHLTQRFSNAFFEHLNLLNVIPADNYPRATRHIPQIETFITNLKKRGYAYENNGSTYFSVSKFHSYGRLAQLEKRKLPLPQSATPDEHTKHDVRDFALWKSYKPADGPTFWNSDLGKGRPGWHIECSCMAMEYLGPQLDIHAGGIDLMFPHHENEIAQAEALTEKPFASFWLHNGFVNIDDEKMSKSLGNFRTLTDICRTSNDARAFRYMVVVSQYRSTLAFTLKAFKSAQRTVNRLDALQKRLLHPSTEEDHVEQIEPLILKAMQNFRAAMNDDLNTPRASAAMFSVVNAAEKMLNAGTMGPRAAGKVRDCLHDMDRVFGIFYTPDAHYDDVPAEKPADAEPPEQLLQLIKQRAEARKAKNFARADQIRDEIAASGFSILDTPQGAKLERVES